MQRAMGPPKDFHITVKERQFAPPASRLRAVSPTDLLWLCGDKRVMPLTDQLRPAENIGSGHFDIKLDPRNFKGGLQGRMHEKKHFPPHLIRAAIIEELKHFNRRARLVGCEIDYGTKTNPVMPALRR